MLKDSDIREPLFDHLDEIYAKNRILEELNIGRSRADIVMVTEDAIYGIEIKSDADTYARLAGQVKDYDKYFDHNYVVVGSTHALHVREHVPEYWGVISVELIDDEFDIYELRKPGLNPKVTWKNKLELLWRPELAAIQQLNNMPKYKDKSRAFVAGKIIEFMEKGKIEEDVLKRQFCDCLFERDYTTIADELTEYRKSELAKQLETETDPAKWVELAARRDELREQFKKNTGRKGRRRRRRRI